MIGVEACKKVLENGLKHSRILMHEEEAVDMRLMEIYKNLKNYDFDVHGHYRMDKNEADKFISWFEEMESQKGEVKT